MAVSNSSTVGDVHIGDIGTLFKGQVLDRGAPFNPTSASEKKIVVVTPNGTRFEFDATITTVAGTPTRYYMEYESTSTDIADGLHTQAGRHRWQGILRFSDGKVFRSQVESYVIDGDNL